MKFTATVKPALFLASAFAAAGLAAIWQADIRNQHSESWYVQHPGHAGGLAQHCHGGTAALLDRGLLPLRESNCDRAKAAWETLAEQGYIWIPIPGAEHAFNMKAVADIAKMAVESEKQNSGL